MNMVNRLGESESAIKIRTLDHLGTYKNVMLDYYFPQGKLNKNNLLVLHSGKKQGNDIQTAKEILNLSDELFLTEEECKMFDAIANGTIIDRTLSLGRDLVGRIIPNNNH